MNAKVVHVKMVVLALMASNRFHAAVCQAGKELNAKSVSKIHISFTNKHYHVNLKLKKFILSQIILFFSCNYQTNNVRFSSMYTEINFGLNFIKVKQQN